VAAAAGYRCDMTTTVALLRDPLFSLAELENVIPLVRAGVSPTAICLAGA
jgi:hypothetical protein